MKQAFLSFVFVGLLTQSTWAQESVEPIHDPSQSISNLNHMSFFVGGNNSPSKGDYGGTNSFLGLTMHGKLFGDWQGILTLQADNLGTSNNIEVRKGAYMFGLGREWNGLFAFASVGVIDTMIIDTVKRDAGGTSYNPYTGASIPKEGVYHNNEWGYMLTVKRPFMISDVGENKPWAFTMSPYLTYASTFGSSDYGATSSLGVSLDFLVR